MDEKVENRKEHEMQGFGVSFGSSWRFRTCKRCPLSSLLGVDLPDASACLGHLLPP